MDLQATLTPRLEAALADTHPRARLQHLMAELLEKGYERGEIFGTLSAFRDYLALAGRGEEEDLILEMIDGFTGWCMR